ncbi:UPF0060 membrane protein [Dissostichus eleginoides]|uniref:UPF0060 membrane protein n=1 Tax=Dissostichus eleginoides TaxID=100907 RepID=A0AAD9FLM9_DISEL|nr:UPF0060 membrane protein [Dissostichus eleginoides]
MHILDKNFRHPSRPDDDYEEQWNKRASSAGNTKSKSKYFNPPKTLPNPKSPPATKVKKRKVDQQEKDAQGNLTWLWKKKDTEVVVAVLPSQMKGRILLIRHCELCSLRPHQWLTGEVIEGVFHVAADKFGVVNKMYLLHSRCHFVWGQNSANISQFTKGNVCGLCMCVCVWCVVCVHAMPHYDRIFSTDSKRVGEQVRL